MSKELREYFKLFVFTEEKKAPAIAMLRTELEEIAPLIRADIAKDPDGWILPYHMMWGMSIRNLLRERGFGETYWPVSNLDDIYCQLIEEAVR
jgi:hypothetical protein